VRWGGVWFGLDRLVWLLVMLEGREGLMTRTATTVITMG
jgi:hypothetical protein